MCSALAGRWSATCPASPSAFTHGCLARRLYLQPIGCASTGHRETAGRRKRSPPAQSAHAGRPGAGRCPRYNRHLSPPHALGGNHQADAAQHANDSSNHGGGSHGHGGGSSSGGGGRGEGHGGGGPWRWWWRALLAYWVLLFGGSLAWDAYHDLTLPREDTSSATVSVIIPVLNEEAGIAQTVSHVLTELHPTPVEVIVVDGGSTDGTVAAARRAGARVIRSPRRGRGAQMNAGAEQARGQLLLFLHADTHLPAGAVDQVRAAFRDPRTVVTGFRPLIADDTRTLWFSTANNLTKTWYGPLLLRPPSFVRGLRIMFGDQGICCRARDFRHVGGYKADIPIMEDAELCLQLHMAGPAPAEQHGDEERSRAATRLPKDSRGRLRMLMPEAAVTSARRIAAWGEARANVIFALISVRWVAGASPHELHKLYKKLYAEIR